MVRIPYIKIPSVRVGSIVPTSNIGTGSATPAPPTPVTYLTQWKIVGNSEVHTLPYPDGVVLPTGYKRCEYLQSDGVAYIEVPFGFDKTDEVYAKAAMLDITHNNKYFVAPKQWNTDTNRFGLGVNGTVVDGALTILFVAAYGPVVDYPRPAIEADTQVHEWSYRDYIYHIDESLRGFKSASWGSETVNLRLFYGHNTPTECKICEYRHKKANAEYRLIPCLDSNDTPCMYDVINNQAYYNSASSGSFTYKLYPQPAEIWSCGEYNATDGKYHILVQPLGGSIADIALNEPLRKVNGVADSIEFPSGTEGKALVTRGFSTLDWENVVITKALSPVKHFNMQVKNIKLANNNILSAIYPTYSYNTSVSNFAGLGVGGHTTDTKLRIVNDTMSDMTTEQFREANAEVEILYELATPTTELVDAPQIEEADSYSMVISQGGKAVSWSSFETE